MISAWYPTQSFVRFALSAMLSFAEPEARAFNIIFDDDPEDKENIEDLDLVVATGGKDIAYVRTVEIPVDDKFLSIEFDPLVDHALIAGIEVR